MLGNILKSHCFASAQPLCPLYTAVTQVMPAIRFERVEELINQTPLIRTRIRHQGYLLLSGPSSDKEVLKSVAQLFGRIQGHVRSPQDGIVEIQSNTENSSKQQVNSDLHFVAHTDGHYLEGLARSQDQTLRIAPPKIIGLQCVKPAEEGGVNFIVDAEKMLPSMVRHHPSLISTLFSRNCMSICRENRLLMDQPVFRELPSGNYSVRFSYDKDLHVPSWAKNDVNLFNQHYVLNPLFATFLLLKEKEILIMDNYRLLHGRTEVKGERLFRRVWVQDESLSTPMETLQDEAVPHFGSQSSLAQAMSQYQPYAAIDEVETGPLSDVPIGIQLPHKTKAKIRRLVK
jgi:hypothetical protein